MPKRLARCNKTLKVAGFRLKTSQRAFAGRRLGKPLRISFVCFVIAVFGLVEQTLSKIDGTILRTEREKVVHFLSYFFRKRQENAGKCREAFGGVLSAENKKSRRRGATALTVNPRLLSLILS